jgi:hypothetical protein
MINRDEFLTDIKEEQRLRKVLRGFLREYLKNKQDKTVLEENRFRKIIRSLINEAMSADVATDQPQRSTGINVLEGVLKNIIAIIEDDYKSLTTSDEQRNSFRAHILNAVDNSLKPTEVVIDAGEEDLEEEVSMDIDVEEDKFIPVRDQDKEPDPEETEEKTFQDIEGMDETGRNFASITFNKIENQIIDAYESLGDKEDRELFHDYLLTNLKLYFDRFEEELAPMADEPESPDYENQEDQTADMEDLGL